MSYKKINIILYISFLLSGISGLIYEVLWAKYLSLIFGNTTYAHTLVLATFMGGLALGSFVLGRLADRVKNKLAFYAWVEMGIALFCVFTPYLFPLSKGIYLAAAKNLSLNPVGIITVKFIIGAFILLPPTILMGGTLPILSKFMIQSLAVRGRVVARLYYINSLGAVIGTLWAGFYLIYHFGLQVSVIIAALINLLIGVTVLFLKNFYKEALSRLPAQKEGEIFKSKDAELGKGEVFPARVVNISLVGIFLSGFVAMLYEIVWIRLLSTILGSSTYSFSLMLAAFISGITIGSFLISKFMPRPKFTFLFFGLCEIFIGISLIFSLPFYEKLPFLFLKLSGIFARTPQTFLFYSTTKFLLSFLVMLPPTVFLGMTLPLVSKIASRRLGFLGRKIGSVFAFNMAGDILGALVTGLALIPMLGLKQTLELGIAINLFLGIIILSADKIFALKRKLAFASICCLIFIGYKLIIPDWNKVYFNAQLFRGKVNPAMTFNQFSDVFKEREIIFYKDGLDITVSVGKIKEVLTLFVNGKADASTGGDMPTQILCAQLPLILKPQAKDVLIVGLGSGVTCGSALLHPLENLDLIEISSSVVEANKYFSKFNYNALQDKRLHLYLEDAKTFLQRTEKRYDLIINEPSNPWLSGIGTLFSIEFFSDCLNRLKKDGLMIQWVQSYEMDEETFEIIFRTFCSVFPEVTVWGTGVNDILIIGTKEKLGLDFSESEKRTAQKSIRQDLSRIELNGLFTLLSLQLASGKDVKDPLTMVGGVNSDYFPILDYRAPLALYTKSSVRNFITNLDERSLPLEKNNLFIKNYLKYHRIDYDDLRNLFKYVSKQSVYNRNLLLALVKKWYKEYPEDREATLAYTLYNRDSLENAILTLEGLVLRDRRFEHLDRYASLQMKRYLGLRSFLLPEIFPDIVEKLKMCINLSEDKKAKFYYLLGRVFFENKDYRDAVSCYRQAQRLIESKKEDAESQGLNYIVLLSEIGITYFKNGDLDKASEYAKKVLVLDKNNFLAKSIIKVIGVLGDPKRLSLESLFEHSKVRKYRGV